MGLYRESSRSRLAFVTAIPLWIFLAGPIRGEDRDNVIETFKVARHGDCLILPVMISGQEYSFLVDTGCTSTVVDSDLEHHLTPTNKTVRFNGRPGQPVYRLPLTTIGKHKLLVTGEATCADLSRLRETSGYDIRGCIGMSFLKSRVVRIDFDAGKLSILKSAPAGRGDRVWLSYDKCQLPTVDVATAPLKSVPFLVDTGFVGGAGCQVARSAFEDLLERRRITLAGGIETFTTMNGAVSQQRGLVECIQIGDVVQEHVRVCEGEGSSLGLDCLSRFVVTFDFPYDVIYLKRGKRFADRPMFDRSGLEVVRRDDTTTIRHVDAGSAAHDAGLRAGDRIVEVDGRRASTFTLFELKDLFATEGQHVSLSVERPGGTTVTTTLELGTNTIGVGQ